jgi:hypothetical protein
MQVSEVEWREFEKFTWATRDWEQKLSCVRGIEQRLAAKDYSLRDTTPKNYTEKRLYQSHSLSQRGRSLRHSQSMFWSTRSTNAMSRRQGVVVKL